MRIELDPDTGWISSYLDKSTGIDVCGGSDPAGHTQVCEDPTDTWGHRVISYAWPGDPMELSRIVVREAGPLRSRVRVERVWGESTLSEELILDHDATALRVEVTLDWREEARLLKLRVPTALRDPRTTFGVPYGHLERPTDGAEEPAQSWVDVSGAVDGRPAGLTVIAAHKHAFDASPSADGPSIGITAARSPVYAWHDPRLLDPDGVYSFQDQGIQRFSYELAPHAGDWRDIDPARRAALLESPVRAMLESSHGGGLPAAHSFVSDTSGPVMITAVKGSEDEVDAAGSGGADLIVRAVETCGEKGTCRLELPLVGRVIEADFGPNQVRTFRIPRDLSGEVRAVDLVEWPLDEPPVETGRLGGPETGTTDDALPKPRTGSEDLSNAHYRTTAGEERNRQ